MGPAQAIWTGLAKSFQFSGRASRSEFWWFAPVGVALPAAVAIFAPPQVTGFGTLVGKVFIVLAAATPLNAIASRRFHDAGMSHDEFWRGIGPTIGLVLSGFFLAFGLFAIATIWGMGIGLLIAIPSFIAFSVLLFVAPVTLGTTIGQLLLPSQPNTNRYGPPPSEVTP